ncbi:MAG: sigma 54-interacting transcriptional regulator, partial [Candidatus Aminicenantes bacterium]|nr:sigma 54-interacting transcriptional regulator [Candidatus Aminicenantes bacterium]
AVETGEITPLGATAPEKIDVRLLAATNKDLLQEVGKGNFREDLFYRLNVVNIRIPPLRERKNDIPLFVHHFIQQFNLIQKKAVPGISLGTMEILMNYHYPGNVRELRNIMEYAFIFCGDKEIQPGHLPRYLFVPKDEKAPTGGAVAKKIEISNSSPDEKEQIMAVLKSVRWNKQKGAQALGIDRTTLWRKMKKYGIGD